jgi:hypothetical protein
MTANQTEKPLTTLRDNIEMAPSDLSESCGKRALPAWCVRHLAERIPAKGVRSGMPRTARRIRALPR